MSTLAALLAALGAAVWCSPPLRPPRPGLTLPPAGPGWHPLRRRLAARRTSREVLQACELLAAELRAGRPPGGALALAAGQCALLAPASEALELGADVAHELRNLADSPGAHDLRVIAAAWQVAHHSGVGLAQALERVARGIRSRDRTRRVVESELASARATARLVAVLPFGALAMGSGAGGDPWAFLLASPVGLACLLAGVGLIGLGLWWIEAIADKASAP